MGPGNEEDPSNKFLKILDMISISIKNTKWTLGTMEPISFKNSKGFLIPETQKPRNQEIKKPRSQDAFIFSSS